MHLLDTSELWLSKVKSGYVELIAAKEYEAVFLRVTLSDNETLIRIYL